MSVNTGVSGPTHRSGSASIDAIEKPIEENRCAYAGITERKSEHSLRLADRQVAVLLALVEYDFRELAPRYRRHRDAATVTGNGGQEPGRRFENLWQVIVGQSKVTAPAVLPLDSAQRWESLSRSRVQAGKQVGILVARGRAGASHDESIVSRDPE